MKGDTQIKVGDTVRVVFNQGASGFKGKVLYMPCAPFDCWHILDENGILRYVQHFTEIMSQQ